ncbi:hypothetical protein C8R47DRAFT_1222551 [Mycena vitilis]|nr:hypothetical protein C8R47DRAFT_1222551 [Mycena vitilis]
MSIPPAALIAYLAAADPYNTPGINEIARNRIEWTWGLGHNRLEEHLQEFDDSQGVLTDDTLLVMPDGNTINDLLVRNGKAKLGVRRPHIQKLYRGRASFQYVVAPIDPASPLPARIVVSAVPPHLALATTAGKIMKACGGFSLDYRAICASFVERLKTLPADSGFVFIVEDFRTIQSVFGTWTFVDYVPPIFLSEHSDQTMVEIEESSHSMSDSGFSSNMANMAWEVGSSASCYHEPKRRLLPSELQADLPNANIRMFPSADGMEDDDDAISQDSHIPGADDSDEARDAPGDDEADLEWTGVISQWAEGATDADADALNDAQIKEDSREAPRVAASLDLAKPDYEDVAAKKGLRTN